MTPALIVLPSPKYPETPKETAARREADRRWIRKVAELAEQAEPGMGHIYSSMLLS
jgi:hypothetical protein